MLLKLVIDRFNYEDIAMKIIYSLLMIALPSMVNAFEYETLLDPPSTKLVISPIDNDPSTLGNQVPTMKELKKIYVDRLETNLRTRLSNRTYNGLAVTGHIGYQTFNYFNSEAKASIKFHGTKLTLSDGQDKPAKLEFRRDLKLDNNSMFESGSIAGYLSQEGDFHIGFRFRW